jgi:hypothetical protein
MKWRETAKRSRLYGMSRGRRNKGGGEGGAGGAGETEMDRPRSCPHTDTNHHDIAAAHELAVDVELRDGWPRAAWIHRATVDFRSCRVQGVVCRVQGVGCRLKVVGCRV